MQERRFVITLRELLYFIGALLLFFEIYLMAEFELLRYTDEIVAVLCLLKIALSAFRRELTKSHTVMLGLMGIVLLLGLIGNFAAQVQTGFAPILTDIGNTFKVFVTYIGASLYLKPVENKKKIVSGLARLIRVFVVILFVFMILHFTGIYPMGDDVRYGIVSYQFFNNGAGLLSMIFPMIMLILTVDLRYRPSRRRSKLFYILLACVVWVSTLRVRAFLYVVTYLLLYYFLIAKEKKIRMNWKTVLITAVAMYIFSIDQINLYFVNATGARAYLARYGFVTMLRFFPLGSGFATFGTDAAVTYYSSLYYEYGFDKVWGLSPAYPLFTHDNYWPAVMAQFGAVGLVLMGVLVVLWAKDVVNHSKGDKYGYMAALFLCAALTSSSVATATFFHFTTVALCFLIPLLFEEGKTTEGRIDNETINRIHTDL